MADGKEVVVTGAGLAVPAGLGQPAGAEPMAAEAQPIVVDMGKARPKRLKELKRGEGVLAQEVREALEQIRATAGGDPNVEFVPVVVIYRKARRGIL